MQWDRVELSFLEGMCETEDYDSGVSFGRRIGLSSQGQLCKKGYKHASIKELGQEIARSSCSCREWPPGVAVAPVTGAPEPEFVILSHSGFLW